MNQLHLGSDSRKPRPFNAKLTPLFHRLVFDPTFYLTQGFDRANLCVPACILLGLHYKMGPSLRTLTMTKVKQELKAINYGQFISIHTPGIPLKDIDKFENTLTPIPNALIDLFPLLRCFHGLALNFFTVRKEADTFQLFPMSLSKRSRDLKTHLQLDFLIDSQDIRESNQEPTPQNHILLIADLAMLLTRFSDRKNNARRYKCCCRACCQVFLNKEAVEQHQSSCDHRARTVTGRRKSRNVLIHTTTKKNKFSGLVEKNGLRFRRGDSFRTLKPSAFITLDFEALNVQPGPNQSIFFQTPNSTIYSQKVVSWCYVSRSLYDTIPLSKEMSTPRFGFLNENSPNPEREFYLGLLFSLREELLTYDRHIQNILQHDQQPPPMRARSPETIAAILGTPHCDLCGSIFESKRTSQKTGKKYR